MGEKEWSVLNGSVEGCVVTEHHRGQVVLPVQRGVTDVGRQVLGDRFVGDLCLTVTLGVIGRGS